MSMELISREEVKKLLNEGWYRGVYPSSAIMSLPTLKAIPLEVVEQIKEEIAYSMDMEPACKRQDNYVGGLEIALSIIDKAIKEQNE